MLPLCPSCVVRRAVESPHVHTIRVWELPGSIIMPNNLCFKFPGIAFRKLFFSRGTIWRGCGNLTKSTSASSSPGFIRSISPMVCSPRNKPELLTVHRRWLLEQTNFVIEFRWHTWDIRRWIFIPMQPFPQSFSGFHMSLHALTEQLLQ